MFVLSTNVNQKEKQMSSKEKKYVHTVNLEIPMDFWFAIERQVVDAKSNSDQKVTKKSHILDLLELGYAERDKQLNKPKKSSDSNFVDWGTRNKKYLKGDQ